MYAQRKMRISSMVQRFWCNDMTQCNCEMIPIYIISILGGLLIGIWINMIGATVAYDIELFNNDVIDLVQEPLNFLSNPTFYIFVGLLGMWQRNRIIAIPFTIYYHFKSKKNLERDAN